MINVSHVKTTPPETFSTPLQKLVYETLAQLDIPFERVDNDPAVTMEHCIAIDAALDVKTVKTLLLCNRQQTAYYLFVTEGDKPFRSKDFGAALGVSRVSFAPESALNELCGLQVGATTVYACLLDTQQRLRLVFDSAVLDSPWFGCTDGTTTCYMRVKTADILERLLPYCGHGYEVITI